MNKIDVQLYEFNLEENLFRLHNELNNKSYRHSHYTAFNVCDPKLRKIHKAVVSDRVLHHAIFRILYPIFDKRFIFDSYSCRLNKGTHKAVRRLVQFVGKVSRNYRDNIFALKCDIRKFFASIDQAIFLKLIKEKIQDENAIWLIEIIIKSFPKGLPLGNVTSQLFANIYLNEIDQFVKHSLKVKYYLRYCDDFIVLSKNKNYFNDLIIATTDFLKVKLNLELHLGKVDIRKLGQGIDFLGYVILPHHIIIRTKTKRRIFKKISRRYDELKNNIISEKSFNQSRQSYLGILKHCNGHKIEKEVMRLTPGLRVKPAMTMG